MQPPLCHGVLVFLLVQAAREGRYFSWPLSGYLGNCASREFSVVLHQGYIQLQRLGQCESFAWAVVTVGQDWVVTWRTACCIFPLFRDHHPVETMKPSGSVQVYMVYVYRQSKYIKSKKNMAYVYMYVYIYIIYIIYI